MKITIAFIVAYILALNTINASKSPSNVEDLSGLFSSDSDSAPAPVSPAEEKLMKECILKILAFTREHNKAIIQKSESEDEK